MLSAVCIPATRIQSLPTEIKFPVVIERGSHPFPFRTRQLSLSSPMILRGQLCGKVGRRRDKFCERPLGKLEGLFFRMARRRGHLYTPRLSMPHQASPAGFRERAAIALALLFLLAIHAG